MRTHSRTHTGGTNLQQMTERQDKARSKKSCLQSCDSAYFRACNSTHNSTMLAVTFTVGQGQHNRHESVKLNGGYHHAGFAYPNPNSPDKKSQHQNVCHSKLRNRKVQSFLHSLYTKDCISGLTPHNASVIRTAYAVCAFKNLWQIGLMVCTKQTVIAPFHDLLSLQVYPLFRCSLCFKLTRCIVSD